MAFTARGIVRNPSTGHPIVGAKVKAYKLSDGSLHSTTSLSDTNGLVTFSDLVSGYQYAAFTDLGGGERIQVPLEFDIATFVGSVNTASLTPGTFGGSGDYTFPANLNVAGDVDLNGVLDVAVQGSHPSSASSGEMKVYAYNGRLYTKDSSGNQRLAGLNDGDIATAHIADSAVTTGKIADGTIVNADISASAAITRDKLDSPRVEVYKDSTVLTGLSTTVISFDTEVADNASMWAASPNPTRITTPATGVYQIYFNTDYRTPSADGRASLSINKNGTGLYSSIAPLISSVPYSAHSYSATASLTSGDYLEVSVNPTVDVTARLTRFGMYRIA